MILWQKATKGVNLVDLDGALHAFDALRPHRLVGCGGYEGGGRSELMGECNSVGCSGRTQTSILHLGPVQRCYGATSQAGHRNRRSAKVVASIEADQVSCGLCPEVFGVAVSASWDD